MSASAPHILVLRDPRESRRKCSLTPLVGRRGITIVPDHPTRRLDASGRILLHHDGEELCEGDRGRDLLLVDCSWRRLDALLSRVDGPVHRRALPRLRSAYPRRSRTFADPANGLASVEALFAATCLLGSPRLDLLDGYRWAGEFLAANPGLAVWGTGAVER